MGDIRLGDCVASFDSEYFRDDDRRGHVVGIVRNCSLTWHDGTERYAIQVYAWYDHSGETVSMQLPQFVYPPVNGTPRTSGGRTDGVLLYADAIEQGLCAEQKSATQVSIENNFPF